MRIGSIEVRNRLMLTAMTTRLASKEGFVTEDLIQYYEMRAKGGAGIVTVELSSPLPSGAHRRSELGIHDDAYAPGLSELTRRIKAAGARASIQIGHAGAHARPDVTGMAAVAPSDVPHWVREGDTVKVVPRALTRTEMDGIALAYVEAASRCKRAGFDMIELQGGHDYLLFQFLSPLDNHRTDEYGGSLDNRARFPLEIVRALKECLGDTPLVYRFSADEFAPGGFTREDGVAFAAMLEDAGVDLLNISAGSARSTPIPWLITTPMAYPSALFVPLAAAIKHAVRVPVAVAGRLNDPDVAAHVLATGAADLVGIGRGLLADPSWLHHLQAHGSQGIRPCIACNTCVDHLRSGSSVACLVNPATGNEARYAALSRANAPLRGHVVVIGGGPAGLTAASALARNGCQVTLFERQARLGGKLVHIHKGPRFQVVDTAPDPFLRLVEFLQRDARSAGVNVVLGRTPTYAEILSMRPTLVVTAIGARYWLPGLLTALKVPVVRYIASIERLHSVFFRLLRTPKDRMTRKLARAGLNVVKVGDCSGTRGVEAAIRTGFETCLKV